MWGVEWLDLLVCVQTYAERPERVTLFSWYYPGIPIYLVTHLYLGMCFCINMSICITNV